MTFLLNLVNVLQTVTLADFTDRGLAYIAIGICAISMSASGIGEAYVCACAVNSMGRNPEMYSKLRTGMILGCALTETTAIYALLLAILILFL